MINLSLQYGTKRLVASDREELELLFNWRVSLDSHRWERVSLEFWLLQIIALSLCWPMLGVLLMLLGA